VSELLQKLIDQLKGLTFVNVAILALLVVIAVPTFFVWKAVDNPDLLSLVFSEFQELETGTDCNLFKGQSQGAQPYWAVTNQFAERNAAFWSVAVRIKFKPDHEAVVAYCKSLEAVVSFMRDPNLPLPTFPGSTKAIFYREHHTGAGGP
jgi:hypothetical protein